MSRPRRQLRWGRMSLIIIVMVLVGAGARAIWANGVFSSTPAGFAGSCKVVGRLPGVADIEIAHGTAFISASSSRGPGKDDGIYALKLEGGKLTRLTGAPRDFHPRGIGLTASPDGSGLYLIAVNHRTTGKFSIDTFEVTAPGTAPALVAEGTIEGGLMVDPQDVAAAGPTAFYVANGTAGGNPLLRPLAAYGVIPGANVLYFNGMSFRVMADGLYGARSLALTPDGQHLIVAGLLSRDLRSFTRESFSGTLTEDKSLTLPAGPEKITLGPGGNLLVAAHASLLRWRSFLADPSRPSPSQVLRVSLADGVPQSVDRVYGNDGHEIGGASVAATDGRHLLIGSTLDGRLLDCTL